MSGGGESNDNLTDREMPRYHGQTGSTMYGAFENPYATTLNPYWTETNQVIEREVV